MIASGRRGGQQQHRLQKVWEMARGSIGWEMGLAVKFEAELMVEALRVIRRMMGDVS